MPKNEFMNQFSLSRLQEDPRIKAHIDEMQPGFKAAEREGESVSELYIYGPIGDFLFGESVSANDVRSFLQNTESETIHVYIDSPGGDVYDGLAIFNQLKRHDAEVIVHVDGLAASAASIIAMAGDKVIMPKTSTLMVHHAWTIAMGNAEDFRKLAEDLDKIAVAYKGAYEGRFKGDADELEQLLKDESFLTSEEAVAFGFADAEEEPDEAEEEEPPASAKEQLLSKYSQSKPKEPQAPQGPQEPQAPAASKKSNLFLQF